MQTIDLAYVGRGIHEELVAYIADQEGYFEDEGVHVALRDGTGWDITRVRTCATIGLGRAVLSDLRGRRLAVHAPKSPPGCFARIVMRRHGLDPDHDVQCVVRHPGDYQMDLRQLRDGSVDAAYVGSTVGPEQVAEEEGFHVLAWVGDHFQIPTVGIAVDPVQHPVDSPAVRALVRANQRALKTMADQPDLAIRYLASFLDRMTPQEAQRYYERYVQPYYTPDGRVDIDVASRAVDAVAAELRVPSVTADAIYAAAL
ncbi:ABC transporter substrate-binding protein [Mycolicibacterium sp. CBMA 361]|uniref:ABC transporter substrate-binding protein n=1 Tax=Mycolicibacterium sp. CBMA 361 TaxID=2606610 RepID=UPI0012DD00F3|nr:ABC transporter substrate-binding protein [Mycolicibacterium sp. CBMA 361]MUM32735.1 ABC transporter substrate-binding protein [Mycolicibacterium sp. CBMA 361]